MIQVLHNNEVGKGLEINDEHKLQVKVDPATSGMTLEVTEDGLKGTVTPTEVPAAFNGATLEGNAIKFTKTDGQEETVNLPEIPVDVHLGGLAFENGKLVATLSDGQKHEVPFTSDIVVEAIKGATPTQKTEIVTALKDAILEAIKGEEIQNFAGVTQGYLLATA